MSRVALFSKAYWPSVGGIETSSAMLARTWRRAGHEVVVVTASPGPESDEGVEVRRAWTRRQLQASVREADVVVTNGYSRAVLLAAVAAGHRPVVLHQGYQLICSDGLGFRNRVFHGFRPAHDLRLAFGAGFAIGLKAVGTHLFDAAVRRNEGRIHHVVPSRHVGQRLGLRDCTVLYQPPNPEVAEAVAAGPAPDPVARRRAHEGSMVRFFGRLVFEKGVEDLLRAFALLLKAPPGGTPPRLVVHGEGPERERLFALAAELGLGRSVSFEGFVRGAELVSLARASSLVVFPSRWEEPGATLAVELFQMGAVVLASEQGAPGEIFTGHGRLFPNGSVEGLADGLRAHFRDGPINPHPTGAEPWALERILQTARALVDRTA